VKLIVDANMVFSAILNTNGKVGDLLINSQKYFDFIAPDFLRVEIKKHYQRLCKISGLSIDQVKEAEFQIYKDITFISEEQIKISTWAIAEKLVADVDPNDVHYIAYQNILNAKFGAVTKH
jgi:predicted nucleic acid-binding protein